MNKFSFLKAALLGLALSAPAHADIRVLVYGQHSGTDVVYRYTLVNGGVGMMLEFGIGVRPNDPNDTSDNNAYGTLSRFPTGTTWIVDPDLGVGPTGYTGSNLPVVPPASVTAPALPAGWSVLVGGTRSNEGSVEPEPGFAIFWTAPKYAYTGSDSPVFITGADAGQTLSGFSVRVPRVGPGSLDNYVTGGFITRFWIGDEYFRRTEQFLFGRIEKQDILPPTLSVTLSPARLQVTAGKLVAVTASVTTTDDYDPEPEIKLESITANEPLAAGDITGAALGTDDRQFQLRDVKVPKGSAGRIYTITYSATDATGNKATASATVSVK